MLNVPALSAFLKRCSEDPDPINGARRAHRAANRLFDYADRVVEDRSSPEGLYDALYRAGSACSHTGYAIDVERQAARHRSLTSKHLTQAHRYIDRVRFPPTPAAPAKEPPP